jgi:hypothetical protein
VERDGVAETSGENGGDEEERVLVVRNLGVVVVEDKNGVEVNMACVELVLVFVELVLVFVMMLEVGFGGVAVAVLGGVVLGCCVDDDSRARREACRRAR